MRLGEGYSVFLFGLDGVIRARYLVDASFNQQLLFAALEQQPAGNYREGSFYYSYCRLADHPLGVLVGVSGDSALAAYQQRRTTYFGGAVGVSLLMVGFTALQTTALSVLLRETAANGLSLLEQIEHLNAQAVKYFSDDSYAAILAFELDLPRCELRYVGAGITQFYLNGVKIETPGMFVGLWDDAEFSSASLPVAEGDTLFFLTDGFTDALAKTDEAFDTAMLERLGESGELVDDATGVCLRIGGADQ